MKRVFCWFVGVMMLIVAVNVLASPGGNCRRCIQSTGNCYSSETGWYYCNKSDDPDFACDVSQYCTTNPGAPGYF